MHKHNKKLFSLSIRYLLIVFAGLGNLMLFYKLFTLPTLKISSFIISLFVHIKVISNFIILNSTLIELVPACIAGSAYYLLFILIMSTADIKILKRITMVFVASLIFLLINSFRIALFTLINQSNFFSQAHMFSWYFLSTILIVLTWFFLAKTYKIKSIPIYSDVLFLYSLTRKSSKKTEKTKRSK